MAELKVEAVSSPLRKKVVGTLRNAIMEGVWLPGHKLGERELCEQTGVSRTLIREALRQLETEKLVEAIANRGLFVARVSVEEAADLYGVRANLEGYAGKLVAEKGDEEDAFHLRRALDELVFATKKEDFQAAMKAKSSFYRYLFAASDNVLLCEILENLHARTSLLRATTLSAPGRAKESLKEIAKIVRAIEQQDGEAASKACVEHVESAAEIAVKILKEGHVLTGA